MMISTSLVVAVALCCVAVEVADDSKNSLWGHPEDRRDAFAEAEIEKMLLMTALHTTNFHFNYV